MTQNELKNAIKNEYVKCLNDPVYFMKKYVKVQNPNQGTCSFDLYPFQEEALNTLVSSENTIILKARQMGISTLVGAYSLWLMTFFEGRSILCISITQETAKEIVTRVRFANSKLPTWLRVPCDIDNRLSLKLKNGSYIKAASSSSTAGRSNSLSLLIIDECAFIQNVNEIWTSAQPALGKSGKSIILSTPNSVGNFFHKLWCDAESNSSDKHFSTIKMPWYLHPERDQAWRDKQTELNGAKAAAQENDCDFATSGDQVIEYKTIEEYKNKYVKNPIEKRGSSLQDLWIWEYPSYSKSYLITADCARGDGSDYSAFHVFDIESLEQVAEYRGQITTKEYGNLLVSIATEYNDALLVVENNNIGWATIQQIIDRGYKNLFYGSSDLMVVDVEKTYSNKLNREDKKLVPGFTTTSKNRPLIISNMETLFRNKQVIIRSSRTIEELLVFIWRNGRAEAMSGYNDDLVMSLAICLWIRDTALRLRSERVKYCTSLVSGIKRQNSEDSEIVRITQNVTDLENKNKNLFDINNARLSWTQQVSQQTFTGTNNSMFDLRELL